MWVLKCVNWIVRSGKPVLEMAKLDEGGNWPMGPVFATGVLHFFRELESRSDLYVQGAFRGPEGPEILCTAGAILYADRVGGRQRPARQRYSGRRPMARVRRRYAGKPSRTLQFIRSIPEFPEATGSGFLLRCSKTEPKLGSNPWRAPGPSGCRACQNQHHGGEATYVHTSHL
jgi:hypothetical protein